MIFIAEDDPAIAEFIRWSLADVAEVRVFATGRHLLTALSVSRPRLVILDITLECELTGNDVLREMARRGIDVPVIVMTGDATTFDRSLYPHVRHVLQKPIRVDVLQAQAREHMELNGEKRPHWLRRVLDRVRGR